MERKMIGILICMILIIATVLPVTGTKIVNKVDKLSNSLPTGLVDSKLLDIDSQTEDTGVLNLRGTPFYAYNAYDPSSQLVEGPVYFDPSDPGTITQIAPTTSTDFIAGGTWTSDGIWYGSEYGVYGNRNIWTIDNETGAMTLIGSYYPPALNLNGLAYDPITDTMYGCSDTELYTIDMTTGTSTLVGPFGLSLPSYMIAIAFDDKGNLYGEEITTDSLYQIDTSTGLSSLIGELGINIHYGQDMAFDNNTKTLYLSAYTLSPNLEGALYTCNTSTGEATKIDNFQGDAQITGFAIPFENGGGPPPQDTTPPTTTHKFTPTTPDGSNDWYVSNVTISFTATDSQSGIAWTKYSLDNGATWSTHTGPPSFDVIIGNGEYQIQYYSADTAGNVETIKGPFDLKIDMEKPQKIFYSFPIIFGPVVFALFNIGFAKDSISGLDRVEFQLNYFFHHQKNVSWWPTGILCPIFWFLIGPGLNDVCTAIVYDKAGNSA